MINRHCKVPQRRPDGFKQTRQALVQHSQGGGGATSQQETALTIVSKTEEHRPQHQQSASAAAPRKLNWLQYAAKRAHREKVVPDHTTARFALFLGSNRSPFNLAGKSTGGAT